MVLAERGNTKSKMAPKISDFKRKRIDVDLTLSDHDLEQPPAKAGRTFKSKPETTTTPGRSHHNAAANSTSRGYGNDPPSSSMPPSSYQPSSQQVHTEAERAAWLANGEDDYDQELTDSTQDAAEGSENLQLYGELPTKIVGVQYYR